MEGGTPQKSARIKNASSCCKTLALGTNGLPGLCHPKVPGADLSSWPITVFPQINSSERLDVNYPPKLRIQSPRNKQELLGSGCLHSCVPQSSELGTFRRSLLHCSVLTLLSYEQVPERWRRGPRSWTLLTWLRCCLHLWDTRYGGCLNCPWEDPFPLL